MASTLKFYIDGKWVDPVVPQVRDVINPATEEPVAQISMGSAADVDKAVAAAVRAFETYSRTSREERMALLDRIIAAYEKRVPEMAKAITSEMGAPQWLADRAQAPAALRHLVEARRVLATFDFDLDWGPTHVLREPIGVCGFITPWNWPINQITCKVAPALAVGCTMVLKPSELAPLDAMIFAEILDEAGVPAGVFNLVNGDGPTVGAAIAAHPDVAMVSFTGSTRAGVAVSKAAADTVKRVALELGGKSPNIILRDADLKKAVSAGVYNLVTNTGQSCNAPSRMLVAKEDYAQAVEIAAATASRVKVEAPEGATPGSLGPLANAAQFDKVQGMIRMAIEDGARAVAGGPGRPEGFNRGYYVRPTVFADVTNDSRIARQEVFGPVLVMIPYEDEEDAIRIANDTDYGLAAYIQSGSLEHAKAVGKRIRAGSVHINGAAGDSRAPFGGYKQSGLGREWGIFGFEEYLEAKSVVGGEPAPAA